MSYFIRQTMMQDGFESGHNTICFYHSADFDGHCSGALVKMRYPECRLYGFNYGDKFPWEKIVGKDVIMVDLSLSMVDMKRLQEISNKV